MYIQRQWFGLGFARFFAVIKGLTVNLCYLSNYFKVRDILKLLKAFQLTCHCGVAGVCCGTLEGMCRLLIMVQPVIEQLRPFTTGAYCRVLREALANQANGTHEIHLPRPMSILLWQPQKTPILCHIVVMMVSVGCVRVRVSRIGTVVMRNPGIRGVTSVRGIQIRNLQIGLSQ